MRFQQLLYLLVCWVCLVATPSSCDAGSSGGMNPYDVLGVPKDATQDDIRRSYRKLCLKYHPDKNVAKSDEERERCEEMFKRVQKANSQIGDEDTRRQYDSMSPHYHFVPGSQYNPMEELFRSRFGPGNQYPYSPYNDFVYRGQSIYVEKVSVPLEDLYTGGKEINLNLPDTEWRHYRAALRGGVAYAVALRAFGVCFPLLFRAPFVVFVFAFVGVFHSLLPRLKVRSFKANLQQGWKGGTKLNFKDLEPGFVVIFEIKEGKHNRFKRVGNDLLTTITIDRVQAKEGCTVEIETMSEAENPIALELKPDQIKRSGESVIIEGKGWPLRKRIGGGFSKDTERGDLVVKVIVQRRRKQKRLKTENRK